MTFTATTLDTFMYIAIALVVLLSIIALCIAVEVRQSLSELEAEVELLEIGLQDIEFRVYSLEHPADVEVQKGTLE